MVELDISQGKLNVQSLITRSYTLAEAATAYKDLDNGAITGRAIVVIG
jgi:Zn-dependent alcohol dehydrogenase